MDENLLRYQQYNKKNIGSDKIVAVMKVKKLLTNRLESRPIQEDDKEKHQSR